MSNLNQRASARAPLRQVRLGRPRPMTERHPDGTLYLRDAKSLGRYYDRYTDPLEHWAKVAPERVFLAQCDTNDVWRKLSYVDVSEQVRRIAGTLLRRKLSRERPIAVISGNGIEHALIGLAGMYVGISYASISPAYSVMSTDFGRLR